MKATLVNLLLLMTLAPLVHGQVPRAPGNVLSPNAASLGQYGEIPVSPFTGIPNISVPLHTISDGTISLPISLSYYAAGFRPEAHPGWVGTGWSLQGSGQITRTVNDSPDDFDTDATQFGVQNGFFWRYTLLNPSGTTTWNSLSYLQTLAQNGWNNADTQPDEFSFSYPGGSGKFYLNQTGGWQVESDKPVTVKLVSGPNQFLSVPFAVAPNSIFSQSQKGISKTFGGFVLTDEHGIVYEFGNATTAIEYSVNFFNQGNSNWTADAWHLTKITYPDSRIVTFLYEPDSFINQMYISFYTNNNYSTYGGNWFDSLLEPTCYSNSTPSIGDYYAGRLIRPVYLRSISTDNSKMWFDRSPTNELSYAPYIYDAQRRKNGGQRGNVWMYYLDPRNIDFDNGLTKLKWQKLERIRVEQAGVTIKTIKFGFSDNPTNPAASQSRLTLLSVQEFAGTGTGISKPAYLFGYYNNNAGLPPYLENQCDHWGFFDARYAYVDNQQVYGSLRDPNTDPSVYLRGILSKITYPTGGITDFEYQQHDYSQEVNENRVLITSSSPKKPAGGLRISKILSYSPSNVADKIIKEYLYVNSYTAGANPANLTSSGIIGGLPQYYFSNYCTAAFNSNGTSLCQNAFSTQPVLPATLNGQGSFVGYSQVIEKLGDGSYTIHSYTNYDTNASYLDQPADNTLQTSHTPYEPFSSLEASRGRELATAYYTPRNICVKRINIVYTKYASPDYVRSIKLNVYPVCSSSAVSWAEGTAYRIYTDSYLPSTVTETLYDTNGQNELVTMKNTVYYPNKLVKEETSVDSRGQSIRTEYKYCFNYPYPPTFAPSTSPTVTAIAALNSRNMVALPLETILYKNSLVVGSTIQTYQASGSSLANITPYQTFQFEPVAPVAASQYYGITYSANPNASLIINNNDSQTKLKASVTHYDDKGNALGIRTEGEQKGSYVWDYYKTLLVAKVSNATPNQVAYTGFEADGPSYVNGTFLSAGPYGWDYNPQLGQLDASGNPINLQRSGGVTGKGFYILAGNWSINRANLAPGDYELTFWSQAGLGSINVWPDNASQIISNTDEGIGPLGFHLLRYRIRVTQGSIANPTGSVAFDAFGQRIAVDDIRLYPVGALMTTYTHAPGIGLTSSSDANNRPVYYEYDGLSRLWVTRDQDRNIVKQYQYHYKD